MLKRFGGDPDIPHLAVDERFDTLEVWQEPAFGNSGYVCADAAFFLGLAAAPDVAAFDRPFACQFTNSSHKILFVRKERRR